MDSAEIEAWCNEKGIHTSHVCVLRNVSVDVTLLKALNLVKALGKVTLLDGRPSESIGKHYVLVQTFGDVTKLTIPDVVGIPGEVGPWPVQVFKAAQSTTPSAVGCDDFQSKLLSFFEE